LSAILAAVRVETLDPGDATLEEWVRVTNLSALHERPDEPALSLAEGRGIAKGFGGIQVVALARHESGEAVGAALVNMPTADNTTLARFVVHVAPLHRRRGAGAALVGFVESTAKANGRTTLATESEFQIGAEGPAVPFAAKHGFERALEETLRVLDLPPDDDELSRLEEQSLRSSQAYRTVSWRGACPDELVEGVVNLERQISIDAPHGDFELEEQVWDEARLRAIEAGVREMGNSAYTTAAVHEESGFVAAYTVVGVNDAAPAVGRQFTTVVERQHRGHRLGLRAKLANLREIRELSPATRRIQSWNADVNENMIRVNDEMGFVARGRLIAWRKVLGE